MGVFGRTSNQIEKTPCSYYPQIPGFTDVCDLTRKLRTTFVLWETQVYGTHLLPHYTVFVCILCSPKGFPRFSMIKLSLTMNFHSRCF